MFLVSQVSCKWMPPAEAEVAAKSISEGHMVTFVGQSQARNAGPGRRDGGDEQSNN